MAAYDENELYEDEGPSRSQRKRDATELKDLGDKLDGAKKKTVEDAIEKVREALKGNDIDAIKSAYDDLQAKFQEVSAELYKQAAGQAGPAPEAGPQPGGPPPKKESDVVDAEFEMVDEDKKK